MKQRSHVKLAYRAPLQSRVRRLPQVASLPLALWPVVASASLFAFAAYPLRVTAKLKGIRGRLLSSHGALSQALAHRVSNRQRREAVQARSAINLTL
jgi:hypothetical protein